MTSSQAHGAAAAVNDDGVDRAVAPVSRDNEEWLLSVFGSAAAGVALLTPDARFLRVNDAFCRITGYSRAELAVRDCASLTHPDDLPRMTELLGDLLDGRIPAFVLDKRYIRRAGEVIWVRNSVSVTRGDDGAPENLVALCQDITEQRQAEMLLSEQNALLELVATGAPLEDCLAAVTDAVSRLQPGTRACILLADPERARFSSAHAAGIPLSFGQGIEGAPINDLAIGKCGEAVYRNAPIDCPDIAHDPKWSEPWRKLCVAHGIMGCRSQPVPGPDGLPRGSLMLCFDRARAPSEWELRVAGFGAHVASIAIERARAEQSLRENEAELAIELADARQLQRISARLIRENDVDALYREILDAAMAIMRSDCGSMQMVHPESNALKLIAWRGFHPESARFWDWVSLDSASTCGKALNEGERIVAADVEACDFMAGSEDLDQYRTSGIRAVQSTPLISRDGRLLGMISTHWRQPHSPPERDLRLLDVLARQVADLIERKRAEEALRMSERHLRLLVNELNHRVKNTLAVVQSLAQQTFRGGETTDAARRAFEGRLRALSDAHNVLTRENWDSADMVEIVRDTLNACHGDTGQFEIAGPPVRLKPKTAVSLSMALHELCTNAGKYGSLSVRNGRVSLTWTVTEGPNPAFSIRWEERDGPAVRPPARRGFGSRMIERALASELQGSVALRFEPEGLVCEIDAPLPREGGAVLNLSDPNPP